MIQTHLQPLPHGITLSCRATGERGRPVLLFLHGFPESAFVWDDLLEHFAKPENGGYRCIAPNLRGFEKSSAPTDVKAYRPKFLVQDIQALIAVETQGQNGQLAALVAHDWGGAVAWNLINQMPQLAQKLVIINSPHPGTFLRELQNSPKQQAASEYMNFLITPEAETLLAQDDFKRLWQFLIKTNTGANAGANAGAQGASAAPAPAPAWLTEDVKNQYREVWNAGLTGGCNLYRASPLRPPTSGDPAAAAITLPREMLTINLPTLVIWGLDDAALPPELVEGLDDYIADLTLIKVPGASHWIVHENPQLVIRTIAEFL
jgi:epoxide hydrolase 4